MDSFFPEPRNTEFGAYGCVHPSASSLGGRAARVVGPAHWRGGYPVGGAGVKRRVPLSPDPPSSRHHRLQHLQLRLLTPAPTRRCLLFSRPPSRTPRVAAEQWGTRGEERGGRARPALARVSPAWRRQCRGAAPELAFGPSAESPRGDVTPTPPPSLPEQSNSELTRAATAEHGEPSPGSAGQAGHARAPEVVWTPPRRQKKVPASRGGLPGGPARVPLREGAPGRLGFASVCKAVGNFSKSKWIRPRRRWLLLGCSGFSPLGHSRGRLKASSPQVSDLRRGVRKGSPDLGNRWPDSAGTL